MLTMHHASEHVSASEPGKTSAFSRFLRWASALSLVGILASTGTAHAGESSLVLPTFGDFENTVLWVVFFSAIIAVLFGFGWLLKIMRQSPGSKGMQDVAQAVQEGAMAYLSRQFKTMFFFVAIIGIGLYFMYRSLPGYGNTLAIGIAVAFVLGVFASYMAGFVGMYMAVRANVRTANAALSSFKKALYTAFRAGAVSGMATVGLGLLGATIIFFIFKEQSMKVLVGFGFGGCLAALFMRIGGGIFTKAADVGADLVGKVEAGIPEDDPRNAATIADNVGDNVGDCAGMAADVFESYEVTLVAAIILGAAATGVAGGHVMALIMYPLLVRAVGVVASILGVYMVHGRDDMDMDPMQPINVGYQSSAVFAIIGFSAVSYYLFNNLMPIPGVAWYQFAGATLMGIILALVIGKMTEYFTAIDKGPVTEAAYAT
jgi:K(+)-stimulated pyrophosphate-energized sodium pump